MYGNHRKGSVLLLKRQEMVAVLLVVFLETTHGLSVVVTRLPEQSDQFAFFDQKVQGSCGEEPSKSCKDYGATEVDELCDSSAEHCSCRCSCPSNSPTFFPHVGKCAGRENITHLLREANLTGCDLVVASSFDPSGVRCPVEADVVTLNTSVNGTRSLCSRSLLKGKGEEECNLDGEGSMLLEDGRWRNFTASASFSSRAQKLQWTPLEHSLAARLIMLKVSCNVWFERRNHRGVLIPYLQQAKSCLLLKSSGRHKFIMLADRPSTSTPSNTYSVGNLTDVNASKPTTTRLLQPSKAPATTDGKFATESVGDGANEALFIVALILGAGLLGVLLYAAVFTVRHRMNSASKKLHHGHMSNPMYGKGMDLSFTGLHTLPPHEGEQGHIYQPLVAHPRTTRLQGVSRTIAHSNPHSAERGVMNDSEPIPRCFSESTAHEVMARNRPKDVVCTPNPIYQEVIPFNNSTVNQSGLLPPPLPTSNRPCRGRGSEQTMNCDAPASPRSATYLELLSDDGTDSTGYLCPLEGSSPKRTVPDSRQHGEQSTSERSPNERPGSFNQNQELPQPPPQRDADDVRVVEDNSVAKEQTLSDDPLLALRIEHDLDYSSDIEISPPVEPCLPVLAVAAEVENPTIKRPRLAENATEIIAPKYYLATQV